MKMNINHLKYFCDAALLGSVSHAASENLVSQSAISQGISNLEEALDCKLLTHQKRLFELTPQGKFLLVKGQKILKDIDSLALECQSLEEVSGILSLGMTHSLALTCLPRLKQILALKHPHLELRVTLEPINKLEESLRNGMIDVLALVRNLDIGVHDFDCVSKGFFRIYQPSKQNQKPEEILVTAKAGHETVILRSLLNQYQEDQIVLKPEISSWEILARLTMQGLGTSLLPDYMEFNYRKRINLCKHLKMFAITDFDPPIRKILTHLLSPGLTHALS